MPNVFRFLFSGNDLHKVNVASIRVEDVAPAAAAGAPLVSMLLKFRQSDPGPVEVRPLLPGTMRFLVDPTSAGRLPNPETDSFREEDYAGWQTHGRILVTAPDRAHAGEFASAAPELPVKPTRVWYGPVRLPAGFLFETLTAGLKKGLVNAADGSTVRTTNTDWWRKHAIAGFLAGRYALVIATSNNAAQDDRVRFVMPTVVVPPDGNIELVITTARAKSPQDAPDTEFDNPTPPVGRDEPLHPRNGLIPAREVYRRLRANMVPEAAAVPLMDAMLSEWPAAPRFLPIHFTRTAELTDNCSVHFPRQTVSIYSGAALLHEEKLPAHGVVFLRQEPPSAGQPEPAPPTVQISLAGTMKWLLGGGTSWREKGLTAPVAIDLAAVAQPHIAVRIPMSEAMLVEGRPEGCGLCCTYMSLRRTVRALVDNRIAGGRLNNVHDKRKDNTLGLLRRAFGTEALALKVANNEPKVARELNIGDESEKLIPVLEAFFPAVLRQGPPGRTIKLGLILHHLWHSRTDKFRDSEMGPYFPPHLIGLGGPGAAVAMGIASLHVTPERHTGEADGDFFTRLTNETLVGLKPGAVLQYWMGNEDFEEVKSPLVASGSLPSGHSPVFVAYIGPAGAHTGIEIIDQNGTRSKTVRDPPVPRRLGDAQIWIAANWDE